MTKTLLFFFAFLFTFCKTYASDYENAWVQINKRNYAEAKNLLIKATKNPSTALDAYLTLSFLQTYNGNEEFLPGMIDHISRSAHKNSYIYSLWFNGSALGPYGKKSDAHFNFLNEIIKNTSYNGSLKAAAHYVKAMHYVMSNDIAKARQEWAAIGAVEDWQLVGPFENNYGSGFNVNHEPITDVDGLKKFKGINNTEVGWFAPKLNKEGWVGIYAYPQVSSAIIYAQTFVYVEEDKKVILNAGSGGSLKIWINDGLILKSSAERVTELDYYQKQCVLKKGYNRVLVQLGYTNSTFPNFIVRFTDENMSPVKNLKVTTVIQPYAKSADAANVQSDMHFAERYFIKKVEEEPKNLLNYILLSQTYLRNQRTTEARQVIEKALKISPGNPLLRFELIQVLMKAENRTMMLKELEWLKENDPESNLNYILKVNNLSNEEKYSEAATELEKMIQVFGEDENSIEMKIKLLGQMEKIEELVALVEKGYTKYPENAAFVSMMFRLKKLLKQDVKGAVQVYERFLKSNYNYEIALTLANEYKDLGLTDKYFDGLKEMYNLAPYDPRFSSSLSGYYYQKGNYSKAAAYTEEALQLAPYKSEYWNDLGIIYEGLKDNQNAINSYRKAVYYDHTNYDARKKLAELEKKTELTKLLPSTDVYALIKKAPLDEAHDFNYLLDEKSTIIYGEGASEEYYTYVVKLYTQKGIDNWKEVSLSYNSSQTLLVEKSEAVKVNGSKIQAERNDDHVVFTGLEVGDAIYLKYRIQNYSYGRLGKEFSDKFRFNAQVPSAIARYTLIAPEKLSFAYKFANADIQPVVKKDGDFKIFTWEQTDISAIKPEPLMPAFNDIGKVLHLSTIKSWSDIANWYNDITYQRTDDNYELASLYDEIFSGQKASSDIDKLKLIYNYLLKNIRYSSVSFRQSGLIPQDISKIISTRLGDCKDLSKLFVTLAAKAGIPAQMVLVYTRDNGQDLLLPSMEFNHCIVVANVEGREYYLELTDSNLPFGSLPNSLYQALILKIPTYGQQSNSELQPLVAQNRTPEKLIRQVDVELNGKDEKLNVSIKRIGSVTSSWRQDYATLSSARQKETFQQYLSNGYSNPVKLESLQFEGLTENTDSLVTKYTYTAKNQVSEAGSLKMLKVPFIDLVATVDNFSAEERVFPVEYWNYESTDVYETVVNIKLAPGQNFVEIPQDKILTFRGNTYSIKYQRTANLLKVIRKANLKRDNIPASVYDQFRTFLHDIVEIESKYVLFK